MVDKWKKISDKEKAEIEKEAKNIMDSFSEKLSGLKGLGEPSSEIVVGEREEGREEVFEDKSFKEIMFDNAPNKDGGFIVAEKKSW